MTHVSFGVGFFCEWTFTYITCQNYITYFLFRNHKWQITKQNRPAKALQLFLSKVTPENRRNDCFAVLNIMKQVTGKEPKMWGESLVGFGSYHYKYESGREGDYFLTGFSPRKQNLTIYIMSGFTKYPELMEKLGKYKSSKSCLYIKTLEDIHLPTLKKLIKEAVAYMKDAYK